MDLSDVPKRIYLDTCVVNFVLEFGEEIFDGASSPTRMGHREAQDVEALRDLFLAGQRADWQLAVSPFTYYEISHTADPTKRRYLSGWFLELWDRWIGTIELTPFRWTQS